MPSAQLFAACTDTAGGLALAAKALPRKYVRRGRKIIYVVRMVNVPALQSIGVRIVLPPNVTVIKTAAVPAIKNEPSGTKMAPLVNGSVIDWQQVPTPSKRRLFKVAVRVTPQVPVGTPLVFNSYAYHATPIGVSICDTHAKNVTVVVKK